MNLMFKPIGILSGLAAGLLGKKIFELLWGLVDEQDPPEPKYRQVHLGKLAAANAAVDDLDLARQLGERPALMCGLRVP